MTATETEELFDPAFLATLKRLFARLRRRRTARVRGDRQSPSLGSSKEFKDRRSYVAGDDFRTIDWRCYARLDRLFVRLYEDIREYHVHLLIDTSASMREPYAGKRRIALRAAAAVAYLALEHHHRVSFHSIGDGVHRLLPPLKGPGQIHRVLDHLPGVAFGGGGAVADALRRFQPRGGGALCYVFSDLLDADPDAITDALTRFGTRLPDAWLVHILDPRECATDLEGSVLLADAETGERRRVFLGRHERDAYRSVVARWLDAIAETARARRIGHLRWLTDEPFEARLLALLEHGQALGEGR